MKTFISNRIRPLLSGRETLVRFSAASAANGIAGMVSGLVIISWIPPGELGIWKSLLIIQPYVNILQGGIIQGLNRELPYRVGEGKGDSVRGLAVTAQTYSLACSCLLALACAASFFISSDPMIRFALPAVFLVPASGVYINYLSATYRADQEFETLAKIQAAVAGLNIATLVLVYTIGYFGIPVRVVVISLGNVFLLHLYRPMRVPLGFNFADFTGLMRVGVLLFVVGYVIQVSLTFPNTILLFEEGTEMVGKFAPALAIFGMMTLIPRSVSQYVYARMSFRLGQSGNLSTLWGQAWKSSLGVLLISVPMVFGATLVFPWLVRGFFPKYAECIASVGWISLAGAFFGSQMFSSAMNSMKAWKWIFTYTATRVLLAIAVPFLAYRLLSADPLAAVASGYAAAGVLSFAIGLGCTYMATHSRGAPCERAKAT